MPYTDKVRARETAKARMQRFRARQKGVTAGVTEKKEGVTGVTIKPAPKAPPATPQMALPVQRPMNERLLAANKKSKKWSYLTE